MIEVRLQFYSVFICQICGKEDSRAEIEKCEAVAVWEAPDVRIGDEVKMYRNAWRGRRFVGLSENPENYGVGDLFYAKPGYRFVAADHRKFQPRHHQLCINLTQARRIATNETEAERAENWEKYRNEGWSMIAFGINMTFAEFLLWRKGDRKELEPAGLVEPPEPVIRKIGVIERVQKALRI